MTNNTATPINPKTARAKLDCIAESLEVIKAQHSAIDALFAMLIEAKPGFYPSKQGWIWDACVRGSQALKSAGETP